MALARAYNDWLSDTHTSADERLSGMALLPMQVPEAAVEELRRAVTELGLVGAMLPSNGLKGHLGSREYWPVYAEAERLGCAVAVHGGCHANFGIDHLDVWPFVHALGHPWGQMIALAGIVSNGILDRHPGLRIAFLEGGVNWFVTCLERFDNSWAAFSQHDPDGRFCAVEPGGRVSDYVLAHADAGRIFVGCEGDELGLGPLRGAGGQRAAGVLLGLSPRGHRGHLPPRDRRAAGEPGPGRRRQASHPRRQRRAPLRPPVALTVPWAEWGWQAAMRPNWRGGAR